MLHTANKNLQYTSNDTSYCIIAAHTMPWKPGSCDQTVPSPCGCVTVWHTRLAYTQITMLYTFPSILRIILMKMYTCKHTHKYTTIYLLMHTQYTNCARTNEKQLCAHLPSTQHLLVSYPQDSTCRRCLGMPNRCARKSLSVIRSFTKRPSASSLYLTTSSAMLPGASSLQNCNMTHKIYSDQLYNSEISLDEQYIRTQLLMKYLIAGCFDQKVLLHQYQLYKLSTTTSSRVYSNTHSLMGVRNTVVSGFLSRLRIAICTQSHGT